MSDPEASERRLRATKRLLDRALNEIEREGRTGVRRVRGMATPDAELVEDDATLAALTAQEDGDAAPAAVALRTTSAATATDDMPTVAVPLGEIASGVSRRRFVRRRRLHMTNPFKALARKVVIAAFGVWIKVSTSLVRRLNWFPSVKSYVGYGTEEYSRLVCRTIYAPTRAKPHTPMRGIHAMLEVPAAHERVRIDIDDVPLKTVQVGTMEVYDPMDPSRSQTMDYSISDSAGYLDLLAEHRLRPGIHTISCMVPRRPPVEAELFTIPSDTKVGVISDVDDTIMVTQVPTVWKAAYNMLLLSPHKRASVPGMAVMYNKIRAMFPNAPFFYLSTSPWNVESQIRGFITDYGFPDGPLLLRDLDPRPKTFVPSGVQHKLEYAEQLMEDFPDMKFILIGDDGQKDPTTYAQIVRRYPGRVLAIGIRQLSPREAGGGLVSMTGFATTQPVPDTDVPVFTGATGANMMKTMLPYLEQFV